MLNTLLIKGVFVTGTDTGVGKTQVTAGLAALLQKREQQRGSGQELGEPTRGDQSRGGQRESTRGDQSRGGQRESTRGDQSRGGQRESTRGDQSRGEQWESTRGDQSRGEQRESTPSETQVRLWKPVQSGAALGSPEADSCRLLHGSGLRMREADIATHTFEAPVAPWLAARAAGTPLLYRDLVADGKRRLQQGGCLLVEGAGGLLVPLAEEQRMADLAADLELPLLIIARTGLGTVNHTLLTVAAARQAGIPVLGVILNDSQEPAPFSSENPDQMARDNAFMIERFGEVPVLGILPWLPQECWDEAGWAEWRQRWTDEIERSVRMDVFYQ